jgi:hypothetical protein
MVGDVGAALAELVGEFGGICRSIDEPNQDSPANTISHRRTNTPERVELQINAQINCHAACIVQPRL